MKRLLLLTVVFAAASCAAQNHKIMIFGGNDHRTYLGCLNCSQWAPDSVLNHLGAHGSQLESESIFNRFGEFGGKFSNNSPCSPFASAPPVIVDERGNYYGELTIAFRPNRTRSLALQNWIAGVCAAQ